jgi:hypothetical protein
VSDIFVGLSILSWFPGYEPCKNTGCTYFRTLTKENAKNKTTTQVNFKKTDIKI